MRTKKTKYTLRRNEWKILDIIVSNFFVGSKTVGKYITKKKFVEIARETRNTTPSNVNGLEISSEQKKLMFQDERHQTCMKFVEDTFENYKALHDVDTDIVVHMTYMYLYLLEYFYGTITTNTKKHESGEFEYIFRYNEYMDLFYRDFLNKIFNQ